MADDACHTACKGYIRSIHREIVNTDKLECDLVSLEWSTDRCSGSQTQTAADRGTREQTDRRASGGHAIIWFEVSIMHLARWAAHVGHVANTKLRNLWKMWCKNCATSKLNSNYASWICERVPVKPFILFQDANFQRDCEETLSMVATP